ncbi:hypothetical protein BDN72DRAFT_892302 [Pluteus cervinus]|uniref:Uncharacterized protein n=1 Tax=Pluteus cervinus TaxID=181527 RepID=A0ACD3BBX6_9AGAR|nr:hypothetical protein BDN72DRAFT_892302 [Pluteus cervinus]
MALVKVPSVHIHDNSNFPPEPDRALFDHAWGRVRQHVGGAPFGAGVGLHEAKRWHRRAYGRSPGEIDRMSPTEIGHAAAYEAFRQWLHDTPSYDPMDSERQRSSLIALAVAESSRLLQYLPYKATDGYSRTVASESAAFTASTLFYESRDDGYRSRGYDRDAWSSSDEYYDDDYRRSRSHSRPRHSRSLSRHRSAYLPPAQPQILPVGATSYMGSSVHVPGITPAAYPTPGMHPYGHGTAYGTHGTYIPPPSAIYPSAPLGSSHAYPGSSAPIVVSAGASMHHPQPWWAGNRSSPPKKTQTPPPPQAKSFQIKQQ